MQFEYVKEIDLWQKPLDKQPWVSFEKLLQAVSMGNTHPDVVSTLLSRLSRVWNLLTPKQHETLEEISGKPLSVICGAISKVLDMDYIISKAQEQLSTSDPSDEQIEQIRKDLTKDALKPLYNAKYRQSIILLKTEKDIFIDTGRIDNPIIVWFDSNAKEKAESLITDFKTFLEENKDELELIRAYYTKSYKERVKYADLKKFTTILSAKPVLSKPDNIWRAASVLYPQSVVETDALNQTDYISLLLFLWQSVQRLEPYKYTIDDHYHTWLTKKVEQWVQFTPEQQERLEAMKDHIATSLEITPDVFELWVFAHKWWLGRAYQLFGNDLNSVIEEMQNELV